MTAKTQAEIQKEYRDRKRQRLIDNNARVINYEVYPGTDSDIEFLKEYGGYTDEHEMLTKVLKNLAADIKQCGDCRNILDI